jgi:hypothetical protein
LIYEYDVYAETGSAKERMGMRRMLIDGATERPVRIEHDMRYGKRTETRDYGADVRIEDPAVSPPPALPRIPFEDVQRRRFPQ